jgi:PmbA protein
MHDATGTTAWQDDYLVGVRRLRDKLKLARNVASIRSGRMPVLFSPTGVLVLGLPLIDGLNGKSVYTGTSPLKGKIGEKIFDGKITILDDATIDGKFGSASFDDEGVAHRRNFLVDRGVLRSFLYDLKTAAQSGVPSTGNGARGLFSPPAPSPTNMLIETGQVPLSRMIAGINEGLIVEEVLGMGQGNIVSGAFSNPVALGFKIEKGEIVGRVKNVSIAGNVYDLLKNVGAVSREVEWVYNSFNLPSILLPDMNVVAKG